MPAARRIELTPDENVTIFSGLATIPQFAQMMGMDMRDVRKFLVSNGVVSTAKRDGNPVYPIKEAMRYLARPPDNILARVIQGNHKSLPPELAKDYWTAKRSELAYNMAVENLWSTDRIMAYCGEAFQTIRLSIMLLPDQLQRILSLPEEDMGNIISAVDEVLADAKDKLIDAFSKRSTADSNVGRADASDAPEAGFDDEV